MVRRGALLAPRGGKAMTKRGHAAHALSRGIWLLVLALSVYGGHAAAQEVLKIGVLGVMSGPAASWGLVNKYCAEATAQMVNEKGGVEIGGEKYRIEVVSIDDK